MPVPDTRIECPLCHTALEIWRAADGEIYGECPRAARGCDWDDVAVIVSAPVAPKEGCDHRFFKEIDDCCEICGVMRCYSETKVTAPKDAIEAMGETRARMYPDGYPESAPKEGEALTGERSMDEK